LTNKTTANKAIEKTMHMTGLRDKKNLFSFSKKEMSCLSLKNKAKSPLLLYPVFAFTYSSVEYSTNTTFGKTYNISC